MRQTPPTASKLGKVDQRSNTTAISTGLQTLCTLFFSSAASVDIMV